MQNKAPEKWEEKTLEKICRIFTGNSINEKIKKEKYTNLQIGYNYIATKDISLNSNINYENGIKIPFTDSKFRIALPNTTLLCIEGGSAGRKIGIVNQSVCFVNKLCAFEPKKEVEPKFLYYYLQTPSFKKIFYNQKTGLIGGVSTSKLKKLPISYPNIEEQQRIVGILDEAFENIDKAKQNALQNLNNAKELFESYLNNTLKNIENKGKFKQLSAITEVKDGTHDSPKYVKEGIPFITQKNIRENGFNFITDDTKYITEEDHDKFYKRSNVQKNDILISMIGANRGMACIVDVDKAFSIKNVGLIKDSQNISRDYLLYYLKSNYAKQYISEKSKGGAQEFVGLTALRAYPILYVSLEEQQKIVAQLDELQEQTKKLEQIYEQKIKDLDELKQSILQKAFNGEL